MLCFLFGHKFQFITMKEKDYAACSRCAQLREIQVEQVSEIETINHVESMCVESASPDVFSAWEQVKNHLMGVRKNLRA